MPVKEYPQLVKRTAGGAVEEWDIRVECPGGALPATIIVTHGQHGGKKRESHKEVLAGKNCGKANETTPYEQALKEAQATWTKKRDRKHYGLTVEESSDKRDMAPMLAKTYEKQAKNVDWSCAFGQPKFNGNRCWAVKEHGSIVLISRQGITVESAPHIVNALDAIMRDDDVFDGELYVHGLPLNKIRSLIARTQPDSAKLEFRMYDSVVPAQFKVRFKYLHDAMDSEQRGPLHLAPTTRLADVDALMRYQAKCIEEGYEGAILRHGTALYETGKRSSSLLKVKTFQEAEFVIEKVIPTKGTYVLTDRDDDSVRHVRVAKFVLLTADGHPFDVTAPGTVAEKLHALENPDDYIGKQITVKYETYTATEEPVPFLPVALGYRDGE